MLYDLYLDINVFFLNFRKRLKSRKSTERLWNQCQAIELDQNQNFSLQSFVPDYFLSSAQNYPDPSRAPDLRKTLEDELAKDSSRTDLKQKLDHLKKGEKAYRGDFPEFNLYWASKDYYTKNQRIVTVFHALEIFDLDFEKTIDKHHPKEKDLVIIDPIHRCVIYVECKSTIGAGKNIQKVCKQVDGMKTSLESWFGSDLFGSDWHYVPLVFHENIMENYKACDTCSPFIIHGKSLIIII